VILAAAASHAEAGIPWHENLVAAKSASVTSQPTTASPASTASLSNRQKQIPLIAIPFSVDAPESWEQTVDAGVMLLKGRSPSGEVEIMLKTRPSVKPDTLEKELDVVRKAGTADPNRVLRLEEKGVFKRLEQIEIESALGVAAPTDQAAPAGAVRFYRWVYYFYVQKPAAIDVDVYEMNILGITEEHYKKDEQFIRAIINSARYEPSATDTSSQNPPTPKVP
jgi:hypothetical protein